MQVEALLMSGWEGTKSKMDHLFAVRAVWGSETGTGQQVNTFLFFFFPAACLILSDATLPVGSTVCRFWKQPGAC